MQAVDQNTRVYQHVNFMRNCSFWLCNDPLLTTSSHDHTYIHTNKCMCDHESSSFKNVSWYRIVLHCFWWCAECMLSCKDMDKCTFIHGKKSRHPKIDLSPLFISVFPCLAVSNIPTPVRNWAKLIQNSEGIFIFGVSRTFPPSPTPFDYHLTHPHFTTTTNLSY